MSPNIIRTGARFKIECTPPIQLSQRPSWYLFSFPDFHTVHVLHGNLCHARPASCCHLHHANGSKITFTLFVSSDYLTNSASPILFLFFADDLWSVNSHVIYSKEYSMFLQTSLGFEVTNNRVDWTGGT